MRPREELPRKDKAALVVEGGAMRGIFACGVLDSFQDRGYRPFDFCVGVSAGATNLAAWLAGQRGRNHLVLTDYSCRPEFISFFRFMRGGHWLDLDWLWEITIREVRLDLDTFDSQPVPLYVAATRVTDGEPVYVRARGDSLESVTKASCALPLAYRGFPPIDGEPMADGGVADSIPVKKAYEMGARDITVVLSRPRGYRKKSGLSSRIVRRLLAKNPALARAAAGRAEGYNAAVDFIENPPSDCVMRIIAPPDSFPVGRTTTSAKKLNAGYEMGLEAGGEFVSLR